jgi:hypothetical protein
MIAFLKCRVRMRFSGVVADRNTTWCHSEITIVSGQLEFPPGVMYSVMGILRLGNRAINMQKKAESGITAALLSNIRIDTELLTAYF